MQKRLIHGFATFYVVAAILIAHSALAPTQASPSLYANQRSVVERVEEPVRDHQRLYQLDSAANIATEDAESRTDKSSYVIHVWTAGWCPSCPAYKGRTVPALLKLGYTVVVKDWDRDSDERPQLRAVPAATIHYKGEMIYLKVAPTAAQIDKFVEEHMPPEPEDDPGDLY